MMPVTVIMATLNGAEFLPEQLRSLERQHVPWRLVASDDGSRDGTRAMLADFASRREAQVLEGPRLGTPGANFLSALQGMDWPGGPVAFCDQDDIWFDHRLSDGLRLLEGVKEPTVACAPVQPVDRFGRRKLGPPLTVGSPSFQNALVENVLCGSTITLNAAAVRELLRDRTEPNLPFHDWWIYLRATAAGWPIHVAERPALAYRQHDTNAVGMTQGPLGKLDKLGQIRDGTWTAWRDANLEALLGLPAERVDGQARKAAFELRYGTARHRSWKVTKATRQSTLEQALMLVCARCGLV